MPSLLKENSYYARMYYRYKGKVCKNAAALLLYVAKKALIGEVYYGFE